MSKPNILSENMINHIFGVTSAPYKKVNWHNAELNVKPLLTFDEFSDAVYHTIQYCFDDEGRYIPELFDFALRVNILSTYALVELPKDFNRLYHVVYGSDLYDVVCKNVNAAQMSALRDASVARAKMCEAAQWK